MEPSPSAGRRGDSLISLNGILMIPIIMTVIEIANSGLMSGAWFTD